MLVPVSTAAVAVKYARYPRIEHAADLVAVILRVQQSRFARYFLTPKSAKNVPYNALSYALEWQRVLVYQVYSSTRTRYMSARMYQFPPLFMTDSL